MAAQIAPYIGYLASFFLIVSLIVSGDIKFRIYNALGCIAFIIYGSLFGAWPVILTNAILLAINIYYISKQLNYKEHFDIVPVNSNDALIQKFIAFHADDIKKYFPDFDKNNLNDTINFVVLRDLVIANIFSITLNSNGDAYIVLNYTTKKYRDFKVSKFIFNKGRETFVALGIKRILYTKAQQALFKSLLAQNNFVAEGNNFVKTI
jgi:hypothetical protein